MNNNDVKVSLAELDMLKQRHIPLAEQILSAQSSAMYPFDFLAIAVIRRSMSLIKGFSTLIEQFNYTCAVPLLRMQIDNCLRLHAANISPSLNDFVLRVMGGERISKIKDRSGKLMSDAHLLSLLASAHPWIKRTYTEASGFVHLSDKHIFISKEKTHEPGSHRVFVSDNDQHLPPERFVSAIKGFMAATGIVFEYLEAWAWVKDNVDFARESREIAEYRKRTP